MLDASLEIVWINTIQWEYIAFANVQQYEFCISYLKLISSELTSPFRIQFFHQVPNVYLKRERTTIIKQYIKYSYMMSLTSLVCLKEMFPPRSVLLLEPTLV